MQHDKSTLGILAATGLAALAFGAVAVAGGDDDVTRNEHRSRIVIVDHDGQRHENVFKFDGDDPRPFLGVTLGDSEEGALVRKVHEDSGAARGGIREGDVIVRFDGRAIESSTDLTLAVLDSKPGARAEVEVLRDGVRRTLNVEIGEHAPFDFDFNFDFDPDALEEHLGQLHEKFEGMEFDFDSEAFEQQMEQLHERLEDMDFRFVVPRSADGEPMRWHFGLEKPVLLGVELVDVTPELRRHLGSDNDRGVLVGRVMPEMPAAAAGIEVGDLIVAVEGDPIEDAGDLRRALRKRTGESIEIEVVREGISQTVWAELPEPEALHRHERHEGVEGSDHHRLDRPAARYSDADRS